MPPLPARFGGIILLFAPLFVQRSWRHARVWLVGAFAPHGPVVLALDDTIERRWGDGSGPCRSSPRWSSPSAPVASKGATSPGPMAAVSSPGRRAAGWTRPKGARLPTWVPVRDSRQRVQPQALLCTDLAQDPAQIVRWFVRRWCVEVCQSARNLHP